MSGFLLDTNVVSELVRIAPNARVIEWAKAAEEEMLYLSVLTLGEVRKGLAGLAQGKRRMLLETWLADLRDRFAGRILSVDEKVADRWGLLSAEAKRKGLPLAAIDGLLAATALQHNLTMVTRDTAGFSSTAVPVLNPWQA